MAYKLRFVITTVMLLQEKSHARRQVTVFYSSTFCLQHTPLTKAMTLTCNDKLTLCAI